MTAYDDLCVFPGEVGTVLVLDVKNSIAGTDAPEHDWPLALWPGGYERGPAGKTIAGCSPQPQPPDGKVMDAYADGR